jgi:DNA-damage-inducible protein D
MSEFIDYFHYDFQYESFEDYGETNGGRLWFARDLMGMLGYESFDAFENVINRAIQACATLKIQIMDNFRQVECPASTISSP